MPPPQWYRAPAYKIHAESAICRIAAAYTNRRYFAGPSHQWNLYASRAILRLIMTNWFADYHNMLLLRLLSLAVVFGVLWPGFWLLLGIGLRSARRLAGRLWRGTRTWQGHSL
jgi:hypothetical protein